MSDKNLPFDIIYRPMMESDYRVFAGKIFIGLVLRYGDNYHFESKLEYFIRSEQFASLGMAKMHINAAIEQFYNDFTAQ